MYIHTCSTNLSRGDKLPQEARSISDVVVLVVLGEREDVLAKESRLLRVAEDQLGGQVHCLQLDYVTLPGWGKKA